MNISNIKRLRIDEFDKFVDDILEYDISKYDIYTSNKPEIYLFDVGKRKPIIHIASNIYIDYNFNAISLKLFEPKQVPIANLHDQMLFIICDYLDYYENFEQLEKIDYQYKTLGELIQHRQEYYEY